MGADGSGARDISARTGGDHLPTWSPDGTKLAFWRATGDRFSIVVTDPDGTVETAVLTPAPVPRYPGTEYAGGAPGPLAWAPDSRRIAFWMYVDGLPRIHTMTSDGSNLRVIGDPRIPAIDPVWSPDGSRIAFAGMGDFFADKGAAPGSTGLYVMEADGSRVRRIAHVDHALASSDYYAFHEPQWQPGGELIAYHADPLRASMHVFVVGADGTGERDISLQVGGEVSDDAWPTWSPDGTRLAFTRRRTDIVGYQIVVVRVDGTDAVTPVHPDVRSASLTWSPDGTRILGYAADGTTVVDIDLSGVRPAQAISVAFDQGARWQRVPP
jgi:TolB protein